MARVVSYGDVAVPKRRIIIAASIAAVVLAFVVVGSHHLQEMAEARELVMFGNPTTEQLVKFLDSHDAILLNNSLSILEHRRAADGRESAAKLLQSDDLYVWYCASQYLGAIGDQRAVPYLIRGLNHPAWRSRPRVVFYLKNLTGRDFGENKEEWVKWWVAEHGKAFDFACPTNKPGTADDKLHW